MSTPDGAQPPSVAPVVLRSGGTPAPAFVLGLPALTVAGVAKRLGVAPATLRTWDRRYGLGPSAHLAGSHRRYNADDLARLVIMRRMTLEGAAPSEAARAARSTDLTEESAAEIVSQLATRRSPDRDARQERADPDPDPDPDLEPWGGLAPVHELAEAVGLSRRVHPAMLGTSAVVEAALRHDAAACRSALRQSGASDIGRWWVDLVAPARADLAGRTVLARAGEDPEAVLDAAVLAVLRERPVSDPRFATGERKVVLLLAAPDESRRLALHALAAALDDVGVDARIVTGPIDAHHVIELCTMANPVATVVLSDRRRPDLSIVSALHAARPSAIIFVGVDDDAARAALPLAHTVHQARTFTGLLHEVLAVCRVPSH